MSGPVHTMFASQAVGLAAVFHATMGRQKLGAASYAAKLAAPDGPSTAGGKQALQHVSLMPEGGGPTVVIGAASAVDKRAELRTYRYVTQAYAQRFKGASPPFDKAAFEELVRKMQEFFAGRGYAITMLDAAAAPAGTSSAENRASAGGRNLLVPVLVVAVLLVGLAAFALLK